MAIVSEELVNKTLHSKILYTRVTVMTFDFITTDEITGVVIGNPSFTNDSTSDIRRTMSIELYPTDATYDITRGGKIWMDKYVKVELGFKQFQTDEHIDYFNMGTFIIDNPTKTYSATENKLTLNCLDIMSRLTGIRGGVIEGITHIIPAGSNVRNTIIALLKEGRITRYIVEECSIDVPNDITVDGGSSIYDLLNELVQLLPNYQIYFDIDGVFHYELIPNGVAEPIMIDDSVWKDVIVNYDVAYDFENVKNAIEVIGGAHDEPRYSFTVDYQRDSQWDDVQTGDVISNIKLFVEDITKEELWELINGEYDSNKQALEYDCGYICVCFPKMNSFVGIVQPYSFEIFDGDGESIGTFYCDYDKRFNLDITQNEDVYVYLDLSLSTYILNDNNTWKYCNYNFNYLGGYQPRATIYETNPDSPFYDEVDYHCKSSYNPNDYGWIEGRSDYHLELFRLYVDEVKPSSYVVSTKTFAYTMNGNAPTSLDSLRLTDNTFSCGAGYCTVSVYFKDVENGKYTRFGIYPIKAELILYGSHIAKCCNMMTVQNALRFNPYTPTSLGTLRIVLSGDEYDNIWSDDLAMQRAKFELYQRCRLLDTVTLTILPIYWLDVNWLVELTLPNETGTEETNQYLIKSISTDGGVNGTQTVTLMRYYPYYPSIN